MNQKESQQEFIGTNVITFPIGPRTNPPKIGLTVPSVISRVFADKLGGSFHLAVNTLDSYKEDRTRFLSPYLELLENMCVGPDEVWHDRDKDVILRESLEVLINSGCLVAENREIESCKCGKVERLRGSTVHNGARLYKLNDNGESVCLCCQNICTIHDAEVLVMKMPEDIEAPSVFPMHMKNEVDELTSRLRGMEFLASRSNRHTGVEIQLGGKTHSLDIDFFWSNYLSTFPEGHQLVVGTNHVAWQLTFAHAMLQCVNKSQSQKSSLVLAPYIYDRTGFEPDRELEYLTKSRNKRLGLFALMNLAWSRQNSNWDSRKLALLSRFSESEIDDAWAYITSPIKEPQTSTTIGFIAHVVDSIRTDSIIDVLKIARRR